MKKGNLWRYRISARCGQYVMSKKVGWSKSRNEESCPPWELIVVLPRLFRPLCVTGSMIKIEVYQLSDNSLSTMLVHAMNCFQLDVRLQKIVHLKMKTRGERLIRVLDNSEVPHLHFPHRLVSQHGPQHARPIRAQAST